MSNCYSYFIMLIYTYVYTRHVHTLEFWSAVLRLIKEDIDNIGKPDYNICYTGIIYGLCRGKLPNFGEKIIGVNPDLFLAFLSVENAWEYILKAISSSLKYVYNTNLHHNTIWLTFTRQNLRWLNDTFRTESIVIYILKHHMQLTLTTLREMWLMTEGPDPGARERNDPDSALEGLVYQAIGGLLYRYTLYNVYCLLYVVCSAYNMCI